jgi:hypothetical protein
MFNVHPQKIIKGKLSNVENSHREPAKHFIQKVMIKVEYQQHSQLNSLPNKGRMYSGYN